MLQLNLRLIGVARGNYNIGSALAIERRHGLWLLMSESGFTGLEDELDEVRGVWLSSCLIRGLGSDGDSCSFSLRHPTTPYQLVSSFGVKNAFQLGRVVWVGNSFV